jgi:hypothetical protein
MIFENAFLTDAAASLEKTFSRESVYLLVIETRVDPFPGPVSPSLAAARGVIRRSWTANHQVLLVGYFGSRAPAFAASQADRIGLSATP